MSTIFDTSFFLDATTRISTPPKAFTAASTIPAQAASALGRTLTASTFAPRSRHALAAASSSLFVPAVNTRLQPAPASTFAASSPKAPDAPVTMAVLPLTSKSESGSR